MRKRIKYVSAACDFDLLELVDVHEHVSVETLQGKVDLSGRTLVSQTERSATWTTNLIEHRY